MFGFGYNKEKSRANAERYLQQNKLQNAISEYEKILAVEPNDLAIMNTVGDVYARLGQNEKAIERFRVIGESYAADGFLPKSIAMYRKITKLDPNGLAAMEKLAELYRKQGLVSDARSMLLQAAEAYTRKGQSKETLRLLKQLVLFDPENVQVITRTADLMAKGGQKKEAKEMLSQSASTLIERHALDPAQKILERLIAMDRDNLRAQELRAQVTLELGDAAHAAELFEAIPDLDSRADGLRNLLSAYLTLDRLDDALPICRKLVSIHQDADGVVKVAARLYKANETLQALTLYNEFSTQVLAQDKEDVLAHLHSAVSRVRNDPEALQTLYTLFQRAGETSMIAEILELQAHASVQSNQFERARDAYKELIELEPENAAHVQGYRQVCARLSPDAPTPPAGIKPDEEPRTLEEFLVGDGPALPAQIYSPEIEEQISAALTEAELCESFSSKRRGIDALELALRSAPEDLRLNSTLALLYRQEGDSSKAVRCYNTMQRVLESLGDSEAAGYYANLAGSDQTTTWEVKGSEFTSQDFDLSADPGGASGTAEEIDLSSEWESIWQDPPAAPPAASSSSSKPEADPSSAQVLELLEEVRFCLAQQIWSEAETAISRLAAACPAHPELPTMRAQLHKGSPNSAPAPTPLPPEPRFASVEVIEVGHDHSPFLPTSVPVPQPLPAAPFAAPTLSSLAAELDAVLGDSFTPAPPPRREAPAAPLARPTLSAPAPVLTPAPSATPAYAFADDDPFQLSRPPAQNAQEFVPQLFAEDESEPLLTPSVFGDLLQSFEQELAAPQHEDDDPETHFNLGIAFREMGLLDEAIGELQKVCKMAGNGLSKARAQEAYIWLATCFVEKSVPEASFKWFLRALESAPDEESRTALNYELASAYAAAGRKREALDHFMEVYGTNIDYRDVASRIHELRSAG
jgi:tetratricopeptide (TPR) repeat protein